MKYYTYAYLREDMTPYYIGKGKDDRVYKKGSRVFAPPKDKSRIIFLKQNLTEEEAFKHEIYMIAVFGRKDLGTGILHNRTDGGEGPSGAVRSEETRKKISIANTNPSQETRDKMSKAQSGENHRNYNRFLPKEIRDKISKAHIGKTISKQTRNKISKAHFGKTLSQKTRDKMSGENNHNSNWWKITFSNGDEMIKCGLSNWAKKNGYDDSSIRKVYKRKLKKHKDIVAVEKLS